MSRRAARAALGILAAVAALSAACDAGGSSSEVIYVTTTTTPSAAGGAGDAGASGGAGDAGGAQTSRVTPAGGASGSGGGAGAASGSGGGATSGSVVDVDASAYESPDGDVLGFTAVGGTIQCEIARFKPSGSGEWGEDGITSPSGYCLSMTAGPSRQGRPAGCSPNITWMPVAGAVSGTEGHLGLCTGGQPLTYWDDPPELPAGSRLAAGETACDVTDTGVTCRNLSGSGFTITPTDVSRSG